MLLLIGLGVYVVASEGRLQPRLIRGVFFLAVLVYVLAQGFLAAVRARVPDPDGVVVAEADSPALFQLIRSIGKELRCPPIDEVKLDLQLNAHVAEIPRWGILGRYKRSLVIGLPLMLTLALDEFKALLAHEIAHLSYAHGKK